jgi:UMF1 family MFS transporter
LAPSSANAGAGAGVRAPFSALSGWVLVDGALQPFYTLVLTFQFAPYFATAVVGDTPRGQVLCG